MFSGSRISPQLRDHHSLKFGFYGWSNCQCYRTLQPSHLSSSFLLSFPFSFRGKIVQFPFRSSKRFFRFKLFSASHPYSSSASPHPSVSNIRNDEDPVPVSFINRENRVRSAMHPPPLSCCLSPAGDVPDPPSARLSPVAGITDNGISVIGSGLPSLESLDVSYFRKLTDKGLSTVVKCCQDLRELYLAGCRLISDSLLTHLSMNCNKLEELGLQGCTNLTDSGLTALAEGCQNLKYLDLNKCINIGDIGIYSVAKGCSSSLHTLKLLDCYKVGDDAILSLAKHCRNLGTLIIGGCRDIANESIKSLAVACYSSLKNFRMDWCLNVSDISLDSIFTLCRKLEALDLACCEELTVLLFKV